MCEDYILMISLHLVFLVILLIEEDWYFILDLVSSYYLWTVLFTCSSSSSCFPRVAAYSQLHMYCRSSTRACSVQVLVQLWLRSVVQITCCHLAHHNSHCKTTEQEQGEVCSRCVVWKCIISTGNARAGLPDGDTLKVGAQFEGCIKKSFQAPQDGVCNDQLHQSGSWFSWLPTICWLDSISYKTGSRYV